MANLPWIMVEDYKYPTGWVGAEQQEARARAYCELAERGQILFFRELPFDLPARTSDFCASRNGPSCGCTKMFPTGRAKIFCAECPGTRKQWRGCIRSCAITARRLFNSWGIFFRRTAANGTWISRAFGRWRKKTAICRCTSATTCCTWMLFPSRPTRGGRILRVFTNLNTTRPRVWTTTESFDALAQQYAKAAGLQQIAEDDSFFGRTVQSLGAKLGIGTMSRTPYDMFMLRFHDYLKENAAFQANCPKIRMEFPPLATWVVFTDSVAHAALSGQYAVEQTFLIPPKALVAPEAAPFRILEGIAGRPLVS